MLKIPVTASDIAGWIRLAANAVNGLITSLDAFATSTDTRLDAIEALGATRTIALAAPGASLTGTTAETTLATITIPAGVMGPNGQVEVEVLFTVTGSTNAKTPRVKFGGTAFYAPAITAAATLSVSGLVRISNKASVSSQIGFSAAANAGFGGGTTASVTAAVNTASTITLLITGQLASSGETMVLESYAVRSTYGA